MEEARSLAGQGVKEIIIIAQDPTQYGYDLPEKPELVTLLKEIEKIEGIRWIRILYLYPTSISDELLNVIKNRTKYANILIYHSSTVNIKYLKPWEEGEIKKIT